MSELHRLGNDDEERVSALVAIAQELHTEMKIHDNRWRTRVTETAAGRYHVDKNIVWEFIIALDEEAAARIHGAYLGKPSEDIPVSRNGEFVPVLSEAAVTAAVYERYYNALHKLPHTERTRTKLADMLGAQQFVVDSFLFQNPEFARLLHDGKKIIQPNGAARH